VHLTAAGNAKFLRRDDARRRDDFVGPRLQRGPLGDVKVLLEQGRRHREHVADVIEAFANVVGGKRARDVNVRRR
jgi:hypothetical protein